MDLCLVESLLVSTCLTKYHLLLHRYQQWVNLLFYEMILEVHLHNPSLHHHFYHQALLHATRESVCVCDGTGILFKEPNPTGSHPRDLIGLCRQHRKPHRLIYRIQEGNRAPVLKATHSRYREGPIRPRTSGCGRCHQYCENTLCPDCW